jgi:hypothetical protein
MQRWRTRPSDEPTNHQLSILRVKPGKPLTGVILSHDVEGAELHYWKGRSRICDDENCEACEANFRARWYGYLELWSPTTGNRIILEVTQAAAPAIDEYFSSHRTLRNAVISASRLNRKVNSKLHVTLTPSALPEAQIPPASKIRHQLERMWECATVDTCEILQAVKHNDYAADPRAAKNGAANSRQSS